MIDYEPLYSELMRRGLGSWVDVIRPLIASRLDPASHGDLPKWLRALTALPDPFATGVDLNADCLRVDPAVDEHSSREALIGVLQEFHPWRKGPFCLHGIHVDSEWRSDLKWARVRKAIDLRGKCVLDVGCGNGYYGWRMAGAGASLVVGIDPTLLYVMQYAAVRHFTGDKGNYVLPLKLEDLPPGERVFDTVFSMGVLYHQRDARGHLKSLHSHLRPAGELVLETLIIDGTEGEVLVPLERYAKMKNVRAVPSVPTTIQWLLEAGFREASCIDVTPTKAQEQRSTQWMRFESLPDFLDPRNPGMTCEGYPAPKRAIFLAST